MAANRLTQVTPETVEGNVPNSRLTMVCVEVISPKAPDAAPVVTFSLQKLVLSVRESNVPVRGRNQ